MTTLTQSAPTIATLGDEPTTQIQISLTMEQWIAFTFRGERPSVQALLGIGKGFLSQVEDPDTDTSYVR